MTTKLTGLELRAAVAVEVLGRSGHSVRIRGTDELVDAWSDNPYFSRGSFTKDEVERHASLPHYETSIQAAWEVVEAMRAKGWDWRGKTSHGQIRWTFREVWDGDPKNAPKEFTAKEDTTPIAICQAALAADRGAK